MSGIESMFLLVSMLFLYSLIWASIYVCLLPVVEHAIYCIHGDNARAWLKPYQSFYIAACLLGFFFSIDLTLGGLL